jgi:hypothetical protein
LSEILKFLRKGQVDIFEAGKYGEGKNIFDDQKYQEQVLKFKQFLGEDVSSIQTPPAPDSSQTVEGSVVDEDQNFEINLEPEDLFGGSQ